MEKGLDGIRFFFTWVKIRGKGDRHMSETKTLKNPKQIAGFTHSKGIGKAIVFAIQNELDQAKGEDKNEYLNLHSKFSRFPIVIINENKQSATANIPINEMINIIDKTKVLYEKEIQLLCVPPVVELSSPAYTVRFTSGDMKGMTPAEVLFQNPENSAKLNEQFKFLKKNLKKYPKNQQQIDAILDASELVKKGELIKPKRDVIPSFIVCESGFRPLTRRSKKDGLTFVYQMKLVWNFRAENPIHLEIENFYAPVIKTEQGLLNVQAKQKAESIVNEFNFSLEEWSWMVHLISSNIKTFEDIIGPEAFQKAVKEAEIKMKQLKKQFAQ